MSEQEKKIGAPSHIIRLAKANCDWRKWAELNSGLTSMLRTLIEAGIHFRADDYGEILRISDFRIGGTNEDYYTLACHSGNKSAADSIDHHLNRKPIRISKQKAKHHIYHHQMPALLRVYIGLQFFSEGDDFRVTSFSETGVVACSYPPIGEYGIRPRVKSRKTFARSWFSSKESGEDE